MKAIEAVRTRNVEWPMNVIAARPGPTAVGGGPYRVGGGIVDGHAVRTRVRIHFRSSTNDRPVTACGLKKRSPSQ
jgi:hypothetical protein